MLQELEKVCKLASALQKRCKRHDPGRSVGGRSMFSREQTCQHCKYRPHRFFLRALTLTKEVKNCISLVEPVNLRYSISTLFVTVSQFGYFRNTYLLRHVFISSLVSFPLVSVDNFSMALIASTSSFKGRVFSSVIPFGNVFAVWSNISSYTSSHL